MTSGSSPRTRGGVLTNKEHISNMFWFIPAHAGDTGVVRIRIFSRMVHPRVRGGYEGWQKEINATYGSSQRALGIRGLPI